MIIHVEPSTGSPVFVLDQIMMIPSLTAVYEKYGIHGIYYCVLFGWAGSPFAMITSDEERHNLVENEVYGRSFYDPIQKEEMIREKSRKKEQYKEKDISHAITLINKLARVPVLEDKISFLRWLDDNTKAMDMPEHKQNPLGLIERAKKQGELVKHRKAITIELDETIKREKELLTKKDVLSSLSDYILKTTEKLS